MLLSGIVAIVGFNGVHQGIFLGPFSFVLLALLSVDVIIVMHGLTQLSVVWDDLLEDT